MRLFDRDCSYISYCIPSDAGSDETGVDTGVFKQLAAHASVDIRLKALDEMAPVMIRIRKSLADDPYLAGDAAALIVRSRPVRNFRNILVRIFAQTGDHPFAPKDFIFPQETSRSYSFSFLYFLFDNSMQELLKLAADKNYVSKFRQTKNMSHFGTYFGFCPYWDR